MSLSWWKSPEIRRIRHRISDGQVYLFPVFGTVVRMWCRLMQRTVRYDRRGPLFDFIRRGEPCIIALWHQDVFPLMFELFRYTPSYPSLFMVSPGRIGTIGAYLLGIYGIRSVAGSKGNRARGALEILAREAKASHSAVFVMADGSRGPARAARWGAIHLAGNTGFPLIPVRAWGDNLITLERTWMKLVLPKPWGRSVVLSGDPIRVPETEDKAVLNHCRATLEQRLNDLVAAGEGWEHSKAEAPMEAQRQPSLRQGDGRPRIGVFADKRRECHWKPRGHTNSSRSRKA